MNVLIKNYISQFKEIQNGQPWVGNSFRNILKNINDGNGFTQPLKGMHRIAEILAHCTVWRNEAALKIETGQGTKTDDSIENWLSITVLQNKGWKVIYNSYKSSIEKFVETLSYKEDTFLMTTYYDIDFKKECPYKFLIDGMLHHDLYHLGKLGLIRKFIKEI
jgi:hypothetical protein